jgi:hypothetical protein
MLLILRMFAYNAGKMYYVRDNTEDHEIEFEDGFIPTTYVGTFGKIFYVRDNSVYEYDFDNYCEPKHLFEVKIDVQYLKMVNDTCIAIGEGVFQNGDKVVKFKDAKYLINVDNLLTSVPKNGTVRIYDNMRFIHSKKHIQLISNYALWDGYGYRVVPTSRQKLVNPIFDDTYYEAECDGEKVIGQYSDYPVKVANMPKRCKSARK